MTDKQDFPKVCHSSGACVTDKRVFAKVCRSSSSHRAGFSVFIKFLSDVKGLQM